MTAAPALAVRPAVPTEPPSDQSRTVLLVAAFDSQLKWCARIGAEFARRGYGCRVVVPDVRSALSAQQICDAGFDGVEAVTWEELLDAAAEAAVLVCGLSGPATKSLFFDLADRLGPTGGPVLVTGWVGVIIEKITAGYLDRCGSDVIAVNSRSDLAHFERAAAALGLPGGNLMLTGLPFLSARPAAPGAGPVRRVLFADQPTVPGRPDERRFLYQSLIDYAVAHPDREVLLKPRHRLTEDTFHRMRHHPETLLAGIPTPPNFAIDYTPIAERLDGVDLVLTVSSTACLEALDRGCRVALVLDLGVHERYGNQVFLESGLLRTFPQIAGDDLGTPDADWLADYFLGLGNPGRVATNPTAELADRVEQLLATGDRPSRTVWSSAYFRSAAAFHRRPVPAAVRPGRAGRTAARAVRALLPPLVARPLRSAVRAQRAARDRRTAG